MIVADEKIQVTYDMLQKDNLTRGNQVGVPVNPKNPPHGWVVWKDLWDLRDSDFEALEEYYLYKATK